MATAEHATQLFQTALLYTVSNEAVSAIIDGSDSHLLPLVICAAFAAVAGTFYCIGALEETIAKRKEILGKKEARSGAMEALELALHLSKLMLNVLVQFASNAVGRLVLWAFLGSASASATTMGVLVCVILLWAVKRATDI